MEKEAPPRSVPRTAPVKRGPPAGPWPAANWWGQWPFVAMGFNVAAAQGLLIRLLLVSFSGNELSIGLMLGNWLLAEAAGSLLASRLAGRLSNARKVLCPAPHSVRHRLAADRLRQLPGAQHSQSGTGRGSSAFPPSSGPHCCWPRSVPFMARCSASAARRPWSPVEAAQPTTRPADPMGSTSSAGSTVREALGATCGASPALVRASTPSQSPSDRRVAGSVGPGNGRASPAFSGSREPLGLGNSHGGTRRDVPLFSLSPQALALHRALVQARWGGTYHVVYDRIHPMATSP